MRIISLTIQFLSTDKNSCSKDRHARLRHLGTSQLFPIVKYSTEILVVFSALRRARERKGIRPYSTHTAALAKDIIWHMKYVCCSHSSQNSEEFRLWRWELLEDTSLTKFLILIDVVANVFLATDQRYWLVKL